MSFTQDVKKELTTIKPGKKCCQLALAAGFLRFAGGILPGPSGMGVRVSTENAAVARLFASVVKDYFGAKTSLSTQSSEQPLSKGRLYSLTITPEMNAEAILREAGILGVREGSNYITDGLSWEIIKKRCYRKSCLRGIFLAAGTVSDPAKSYHIEIVCMSEYMAQDVRKLINSFGLKSKVSQRRNRYVVYLKDSEQIADLLSLMGVSSQLFRFQNVMITKEMKGTANRIANCESANLQRSVNSAQAQIADIEYIEKTRGLLWLGEKLKKTAELRRDNPELSLSELAALFDPPLAKSGLSHRLSRISELADYIRSGKA